LLLLANQEHVKEHVGAIQTIPMIVDLFEITRGPTKFWAKALELHNQGKTSDQIAEDLGTNRGTANRSVRYGKALLDAGLTDPFIELFEAPRQVSRWKLHPRFRTTKNHTPGITNPVHGLDQHETDDRLDDRKQAI
jgi:hypothetical protein